MKKIIGILRPFEYEQQFFVYEDGNKIDKIQSSIEQVPETILKLAQQYELSQIDLTGPKQYIQGISHKIKETELLMYNQDTLQINII